MPHVAFKNGLHWNKEKRPFKDNTKRQDGLSPSIYFTLAFKRLDLLRARANQSIVLLSLNLQPLSIA